MVEILVVVAVGIILFLGIEQYLNASLQYALLDNNKTEALYLAKSYLEEARAVRDESWASLSDLTAGSQYKFAVSGSAWAVQAGTETSGKYTVWMQTAGVQRDANKNIVPTGTGTDDLKDGKFQTLKVTASVSWNDKGGTQRVDLSEYLANFK